MLKLGFNCLNSGLANNGGSRTILKSSETLNKLGHDCKVISVNNNFTWFRHAQPIYSIPNNLDAVIATACTTVDNTARSVIPKKYWWIRGHENWAMSEKQLIKLYNREDITNITNSITLKEELIEMGCTQPIHVIYQGIDFDHWKNTENRNQGEKIKIGCLFSDKKLKRWEDFKKLQSYLGFEKYDYLAFGSTNCQDESLSCFISNPSVSELQKLYSSCHFWFAPTNREGLHNVPMEASLCGCLIICGDYKTNGMTRDYAFNKKSALTYSSVEEAVDIIKSTCYYKSQHIIEKSQEIITKNIGSREHNMQKLSNLITQE